MLPIPWVSFRVVRWRFPFASVSSTGASSHILISRRTRPSLIRRDYPTSLTRHGRYCRNIQIGPRPPPRYAPRELPLDLANGVQGAAFRAIGVLFGLQVGLEDRLQD